MVNKKKQTRPPFPKATMIQATIGWLIIALFIVLATGLLLTTVAYFWFWSFVLTLPIALSWSIVVYLHKIVHSNLKDYFKIPAAVLLFVTISLIGIGLLWLGAYGFLILMLSSMSLVS